MSIENTAHTIAAEQGWTDTTLLTLCATYVSNQQADDAFTDYLRGVADEENEGTEDTTENLDTSEAIIAAQGWTDTTMLDLHLTYIDRQQSDDAFADFLRSVADEENGGPSRCPLCGGEMIIEDFTGMSYCADDCTEADEETCAAEDCNDTLDDGEGYDGYCGYHADLIESHHAGEHATHIASDSGANDDCPECATTAVFGQNVAFPNGRCVSCGSGLDEAHRCYQRDCSRFDAGSPYAGYDDGVDEGESGESEGGVDAS